MSKWLSLQKLRFDLGASWMYIINFSLLVLTTSKVFGLHAKWFVPIFIFIALFCVWFWGFILYEVLKVPQKYEMEAVNRSVLWKKVFEQLNRIENNNHNLKDKEKHIYPYPEYTNTRGKCNV